MSTNIALVSGGVIQDIGPPHDIYFKPRTKFAASFVGTSNLLPGRFEGEEGPWSIVSLSNGQRLRGIAREKAAIGAEISVMMRPESVQIAQNGDAAANLNSLEGEIYDHFLQGATWKTIVTVGEGNRIIIQHLANSAGRDLPRGTKVLLTWLPDNTHLLAK